MNTYTDETYLDEVDLLLDDEMAACPVCGAPNPPLGTLGKLRHYSGADCGMQYSQEV